MPAGARAVLLTDCVVEILSPAAGGFLQLLHHVVDTETRRLLPWRKLFEARDPFRHEGLRRDERKHAMSLPVAVVDCPHRSFLERVGAQIDECWGAQLDERLRPDLEALVALLLENGLPSGVA